MKKENVTKYYKNNFWKMLIILIEKRYSIFLLYKSHVPRYMNTQSNGRSISVNNYNDC